MVCFKAFNDVEQPACARRRMAHARPSRTQSLRIAFIGTRGIPARYSGFETFVEQLGARLAGRGHDVTVYSRKHHAVGVGPSYRGMKVVRIGGIATKHLDTISHTLVSCLHSLFRPYDVVVMCISGNSPLAFIPRVRGAKVVLNVDGSDWRREKWGKIARSYIKMSEWLSVHLPNVTVTDSTVMHRFYLERFGVDTECIWYGSDLPLPEKEGTLEALGLTSRRYLLLVGRLVPENCIHHLVDGFGRLDTDLTCVIVGDAPYQKTYIADLKRRGPGIIFTGYLFGDGYSELMHNAYAVVLCTEVGGTHPVLVEAMAAGNCVVVNNTPANLEVIGSAGLSYAGERGAQGLLDVLQPLVTDESRVQRYRELATMRARARYSWEAVTDQYERLFERLTGSTVAVERTPVSVDSGRR
jgi:glycosyltransferase involved in cell wall biosynthesis